MSTLALSSFDTLQYVKRLKAANVPEEQAEAQAEALRAALDTNWRPRVILRCWNPKSRWLAATPSSGWAAC